MEAQPAPLYSKQSEDALLGALLIDPSTLNRVTGIVKADDMYEQRNSWLFETLLEMNAAGTSIDFVTVCAALENRGQLNELGGAARLSELTTAVPSALHVQDYAMEVASYALRRRLTLAASDLARAAYDTTASPADLQAKAEAVMQGVATAVTRRARPASEIAGNVLDRADANQQNPVKPGETRYLDTGFVDLNRFLGGWRAGLYVILGVTHCGKTWFCMATTATACDLGKHVVYFPLEMTAEQLVERWCLSHTQVDSQVYERGGMTPDQWAAFTARAGQIGAWDIVIDDVAQSIHEIIAVVRREHALRPVDLVVVDSLGLLTGTKQPNRNLEMGEYTRRLKLLSRELGAPILSPHHVSDKAIDARKDKRPRASDAYESGHVHQDADGLLALYRDEMYNLDTESAHIMEVMVLKDRLGGGTAGLIQLFFARDGRILDAETRRPGGRSGAERAYDAPAPWSDAY